MGYTHAWYRDRVISDDVYALISTDFNRIVEALPVEAHIAEVPDLASPGDIVFSGFMGDCEPMVFEKVSNAREITPDRAYEPWQTGKYFVFCKTERLPYDLAVMAFLVVAKHRLGNAIRVTTDGAQADWRSALDLVQNVLGYGNRYSIVNRELLPALTA